MNSVYVTAVILVTSIYADVTITHHVTMIVKIQAHLIHI